MAEEGNQIVAAHRTKLVKSTPEFNSSSTSRAKQNFIKARKAKNAALPVDTILNPILHTLVCYPSRDAKA